MRHHDGVPLQHIHRAPRSDDLFIERVGSNIVRMPNGCWAYKGELDRYHQISGSNNTRTVMAHRYVYMVLTGESLLDDEVLHHKCFNPGCVNPGHLQPMEQADHLALHAAIRRTETSRA